MNQIFLDGELKKKLNGLDEELEFCDESGKTIGRFLPAQTYQRLLYTVAEAQRPPLSDDEIERRRRETARSLEEIWEDVGQ